MRAGKHTMFTWLWSPSGAGKPLAALYNLQAYHLFGDPMMRIRVPGPAVDD